MARVPLKMTVVHRGKWGRFAAAYDQATTETVKDAVEEGARLSRSFAPVGVKHDPRTIPLKDSIEPVMETRTKGHWVSHARHAKPVEFGSRPHPITANVRFWWESAGRWWVPGEGFINHPGNRAQPFMRPARDIVAARLASLAKKNFARR